MKKGADTHEAKDCSYAKVSAAVAAADAGDTVLVPQGSETWSGTLTITKGIIFKGAGVGKTVITSNVPNGAYLIIYAPTNPSLNEPFRLTGFTFDFNDIAYGLHLRNKNQSILNKIRVDHNTFINCGSPFMTVHGPMYGVVDNNVMTGTPHIDNYAQDSCLDWSNWSDQTSIYGKADNIYYEDNYITTDDCLTTGGHGGRYVYRYNTITINRPGSGSVTPLFDMHGNQPNGVPGIISPRGGEIYGNSIRSTNPHLGTVFVGHRGGSMLIHSNKLSGFAGTIVSYVREEYGYTGSCSTDYPMYVRDSYYWNNRYPNNLIDFSEKKYANKNATFGGNNFIESTDLQSFCQNTCHWHSVRILSGQGAGQFRNVSSVSDNRIYVTVNWATNPNSTSVFEVVEDCCDNIHPNVEFFNQVVPFVTILSPNGGGNWKKDTTQTIRWAAEDMTGDVEIALYKSGVSVQTLAKVPVTVGTCSWIVNNSLTDGVNYKVRIYQGSVADYSDESFSINSSNSLYAVKFAAGPGGNVSGVVDQTVSVTESTSEVTAVPNSGYVFSSWSGGTFPERPIH